MAVDSNLTKRVLELAHVIRFFDFLLSAVLMLVGFLIGRLVQPHCRVFSWEDPSISYAYSGRGTFPSWTLVLIAILPCFVYVLVEVICAMRAREDVLHSQENLQNASAEVSREDFRGGGSGRRELNVSSRECSDSNRALTHECFLFQSVLSSKFRLCFEIVIHWILAQMFSLALSIFIVDSLKVYAGRLRPDFLSRLVAEGYNNAPNEVDWCGVAREGRLSFPSGHSAISFASFVPLTLYIMGLFQAFRGGLLWRFVLAFLPLSLPMVVAVSRTRDNRHHFSDIVAGSLIGICGALLSVRLLFVFQESTGVLIPRRLKFASKRQFNQIQLYENQI